MEVRRVCYVVEGMVDVRLIEGLSQLVDLTLLSDLVRITTQPTNCSFVQILGPPNRLRFALFVAKYLAKHHEDFDSIVIQGYGLPALAANLALFKSNSKLLLLVCSPSEYYYECRRNNPTVRKKYRYFGHVIWNILGRLNAKLTTNYVVLSNYLSTVVQAHGAKQSSIKVIPVYGVNTNVFTPSAIPLKDLRKKMGLPVNAKLLLYSSRVAPEKDFRTVLYSLKQLVSLGMDVWLINASGGYLEFLDEARQIGVADRVIAMDAVHPSYGLAELYQASDVCIQASLSEGLGFSPLEALACGIPVVATAVGGLKETIISGVTGWSIPPADEGKLTSALLEILSSPDEVNRRVAFGREMVLSQFAADKVMRDFVGLL